MAGFKNEVMNAQNVNFGTVALGAAEITQNGQLMIGSAVSPNIRPGFLTSTGGTITITNGAGTINLELAGGGVGIDSIAVQAVTAPGVSPVLPTGAGLLTINGASVAALGIPMQSRSIALNSLQLEVQRSSAQGASAAANAGIASFSNTAFSVDANGFVSLAGGGTALTSVPVQASTAPGTNPVVPSATGSLTINGAAVAAAGIPVRSDSIAVNSLQIEVQRASSQGASSAANAGLASFVNTAFSVDANGFVTLAGGGIAATAFDVDAFTAPGTDPVVPTAAGVVTVSGAQVAAGTNPIRTNSIAANAYQIQVQRSQATVGSTLTANGVAHFNSAQFTVDANGFVSSISGAAPWLDSAGGALANHTGYFATAAAVFTLPVGTVNGDMVEIIDQVGGGIVVTAPGAQIIQIQNTPSSAGGTATSTQKGDALRLVFRLADLTWYQCPGAGGIWILA